METAESSQDDEVKEEKKKLIDEWKTLF